MNAFDILQERGFIKQCSHEKELREKLAKDKISFYIGFDATADSLHVGHYVQLMAMAHLQRAGHRPLALIGGGTTLIGDPSGKTDMRKMMTRETIDYNGECFKRQMRRFVDFEDGKALMVNNADWLLDINYVEFLRDVGVHFSVNRMLAAESVKNRLEKGLTFMEFNYMLMQSYDFLVLNEKYDAVLQCGGDDQWSNILAGADLIRRKKSEPAFALTFTLLETSEGIKMGKTVSGALWLDAEKTSAFDFYQYWVNVEDAKVVECLKLLTFLPIDHINELAKLEGSDINKAKKILAYEVTKNVHDESSAIASQEAAESLFGGSKSSQNIPSVEIAQRDLEEDFRVTNLLVLAGLCKSKGEGRRLIQGGGVFIDDVKVDDENKEISLNELRAGFILQKGKKSFVRISLA